MPENINVDLINNTGGQGELASYLMENGRMDSNAMRPYVYKGKTYISVYKGSGERNKPENYKAIQVNSTGTLRPLEWRQLDEAILPLAESRLIGINHLISKGLVYNLGNAMGTTVLMPWKLSFQWMQSVVVKMIKLNTELTTSLFQSFTPIIL
jgi:hypothetical protein